jgi:hypothetical protein
LLLYISVVLALIVPADSVQYLILRLSKHGKQTRGVKVGMAVFLDYLLANHYHTSGMVYHIAATGERNQPKVYSSYEIRNIRKLKDSASLQEPISA